VAYLDGTLFHRDADAIDRHVETCAECTALLAAMRQTRAAEQASKTARTRAFGVVAVVVIALVGYGLWAIKPRSTREAPRGTEPVPTTSSGAALTSRPSAPPVPDDLLAREIPRPKITSATPVTRTRPPGAAAAKPATAKPVSPRVMWRTRDVIVESSSDGGATWVTEHTADRPIRASAFVNADVVWVVGDNGLVLRRTKNGWFGASPPADGNIIAVKASSPSKAAVTLEDGRVFTTANGGVTWTPAP